MGDIYKIVNNLVLDVNNKIEDFIVSEVDALTNSQKITVNAQMIAEALEKQIAKTPDYEGDGYADGQLVYDTWICPNCETRYEVDYDNYKYCPNCGQRLDLSKESD